MQPRIISVRIADVHEELKNLMARLDELPTPAEVGERDGPQGDYVDDFNKDFDEAVGKAQAATKAVITELANVDSTVRAALDDLKAQDEDLEASVERFESYMDNAAEQAESMPAGGGQPRSAGSATDAGSVDFGSYGREGTST